MMSSSEMSKMGKMSCKLGRGVVIGTCINVTSSNANSYGSIQGTSEIGFAKGRSYPFFCPSFAIASRFFSEATPIFSINFLLSSTCTFVCGFRCSGESVFFPPLWLILLTINILNPSPQYSYLLY